MTYWYISFASETSFLGATIVEGSSAEDAIQNATKLGLNPGGEAALLRIPGGEDCMSDSGCLAMHNKLLNEEEMHNLPGGSVRYEDLEGKWRELVDDYSETICSDCNPVRN